MGIKLNGLFAAAVVMAFVVTGCKAKPADNAASTVETKPLTVPIQSVAPDTARLGSVEGVVKFAGKAPAPVKIDMSMDPACGMSSTEDNMSEQFAVRGGKLGNVFVYVKSGPPAAFSMGTAGGPAVVMDQKGCKYVPHVVGVTKGQSVEFRNSDVTMHNIHTLPTAGGSQSIDISQSPKGAPQIKRFDVAETMIPVRCNNHPWMNAFINVSQTPFFDVSDGEGRFSLKGLPAGEYTVAAVHEKLGEQTIQVSVKPESTATASFTFSAK